MASALYGLSVRADKLLDAVVKADARAALRRYDARNIGVTP
jgi:hypothetical protein